MTEPRTVADLCAVTGLHEDTVRAGILAGDLPGYKVGSRFTVPGDAFDDFCHGRWVPIHRRVVEVVTVSPGAGDFLKRRKAS